MKSCEDPPRMGEPPPRGIPGREAERRPRPLRGWAPVAVGTLAGGSPRSYLSSSLGNTAPRNLRRAPSAGSSLPFLSRRFGSTPCRRRRRLCRPLASTAHRGPAPQPPDGHWHSPGPISAACLRPRHQSAPAGGGASPMSSRLLLGPQDPFCLGRDELGLRSRHFRQEAFPLLLLLLLPEPGAGSLARSLLSRPGAGDFAPPAGTVSRAGPAAGGLGAFYPPGAGRSGMAGALDGPP